MYITFCSYLIVHNVISHCHWLNLQYFHILILWSLDYCLFHSFLSNIPQSLLVYFSITIFQINLEFQATLLRYGHIKLRISCWEYPMSLFFNRCHVDITCIVLIDLSYLYMLTWQPKQFWMLQRNFVFQYLILLCLNYCFLFLFFLYVGRSSNPTISSCPTIPNSPKSSATSHQPSSL